MKTCFNPTFEMGGMLTGKNLKLEDKKFFLFNFLLMARLFVCTFFLSGCYADGSYAFMEVLNRGNMFLWYGPRNTAMAFTRFFVWFAMKLGCNSIKFLTICYSFGCNIWVTVFICLSVFICKKYQSWILLDYTISVWSMILAFTGLYCMHESFFTTALIWLLFVFNYHLDQLEKAYYIKALILLLLLAAFGGTYESFGIFGFVLIVQLLIQIKKNSKKITLYYAAYFVLVFANTLLQLHYILHPLNPDSRNGYLSQLLNTNGTMLLLIVLLGVYMAVSALFYNKKFEKERLIIELLVSILIFVYLISDIDKIVMYTRTVRGIFHLLIPLGMMILTSIQLFKDDEHMVNATARMSWILMAGSAFAIYMTSYGYAQYLKNIAGITVKNEGFIVWPIEGEKEVYTTDWPIPFESIIAQIVYEDVSEIKGIVVQKQEYIYFQPFNMWDIDAYYHLEKYGISYNKNLFK